MEYILINDSKLKVMLERCDLEEWNISAEQLDYANPDSKRVFNDILHYAKLRFGFDTSGQKVLLQLFPSKDGSCEVFISCIGKSEKLGTDEDLKASNKEILRAYSFESAEHLLLVCKILKDFGGINDSSAWFDEEGNWYLTLTLDGDIQEIELLPLHRFSFIGEYGETISAKSLCLYLSEYGKPICEANAVEILGAI